MVVYKAAFILLVLPLAYCRIYDKCTLARELLNVYKFPRWQIPTWICIVEHESHFNTAAINSQTHDNGLFQISQIYWCDPPNHPQGCQVQCSKLRDDDIHDDVTCVKKVYDEFQRTKGNGFKAWTTYDAYCNGNNGGYIKDCHI
ncbi:lysozyme C, milk isozyme-like [Diabrotica virgifera virgifera]|uniref:lysozyme n=1 Tax=Diabrotica virgifera virgifera TaxID=50390 RepID=A0ABM5IJI2_DIAVI|nr:lysozyme C, milk isozyme-like [Diabrotica virgifera virgifera]